jgi:hypothetical protein
MALIFSSTFCSQSFVIFDEISGEDHRRKQANSRDV